MLSWKKIIINGKPYCSWWVPAMNEGRLLTFGECRKVVKSIREVEKQISNMRKSDINIHGWSTWSEDENYHIKPILLKLGANEVYHKNGISVYTKEVR